MAPVPDVPFYQLNPLPPLNLGALPYGRISPVQAVGFYPGASLSCDQFPAPNSSRITISMWALIPSSHFPIGRRQTLMSFGKKDNIAIADMYVMESANKFDPNANGGTVQVTEAPDVVEPPGRPPWVWFDGAYWQFRTFEPDPNNESRIEVVSAGLRSGVYSLIFDTKGNPVNRESATDFTPTTDGRKNIQFVADYWNWVAFSIRHTDITGIDIPLSFQGTKFSFPSLPENAADNVPVAYAQVQVWTNRSLSFADPITSSLFTLPVTNLGDLARARPSIATTTIKSTMIPGEFAPPAQDFFGQSDILFDGDSSTFIKNRGSRGAFIKEGTIVTYPAGP